MDTWDVANRTDPSAHAVHGKDPQLLVDAIVRARIYDSPYWKEQCFALNAETLVDKAVELTAIGGVYGAHHVPTPFVCLLLRMLAIQPADAIVDEFVRNADYKYVRVLGAFYVRLTGRAVDVYRALEPLYADYRKLRRRRTDGGYDLSHVDEVVDELLRAQRCCDITLPALLKREVLEQTRQLGPRPSLLQRDFEAWLDREQQQADGDDHDDDAGNDDGEDGDDDRQQELVASSVDAG
jgi:pre-mRNA-splicing factor 38A